jgi:hypothetical protein
MSLASAHPIQLRHADHVFFTGMAVAAAIIVFAGFAPTYYLRSRELPPLSPLVHVHGLAFTAWFLLFLGQTGLIAAHRSDIHRRLGIIGTVLAAVMFVLGVMLSLDSLQRGVAAPGLDPRGLLSIPLGSMIVFAILVTMGVAFRREREAHKRFMLLATINLLSAPIGRIVLLLHGPVLTLFLFTDLFVAVAILYDLMSRRHVHPVNVWGGSLVVVFKPLLVLVANTPAWLAFADMMR